MAVSLALHAAVLAPVVLGPPPETSRKAKSLYEQVIAPNETKLVWYDFRKKLPEVSPGQATPLNPREGFTVRLPQTIVSSPPEAPAGAQLIWRPAPRIRPQPEIASPNMLSFRMPKILPPPPGPPRRLFFPPAPVKQAPQPPPELPAPPVLRASAPRLDAALFAPAARLARPKPREFTRPPETPQQAKAAPVLPEAPAVATALRSARVPLLQENLQAALANRPKSKEFVPPALRAAPLAAVPVNLPDAPAVRGSYSGSPAAPVARMGEASLAALAAKPQPRPFVPPAASGANGQLGGTGSGGDRAAAPAVEDAPWLAAAASYGSVDIAIVSLNPAPRLAGPLPESSRPARFAGGPELDGEMSVGGGSDGTRLSVPGLTIRGPALPAKPMLLAMAPPTSRENLAAAARAIPPAPAPESAAAAPQEIRLAAPDPRLAGREVYTLAVQMPNITSYEGSWILWFAERQHTPRQNRGLRPPVPLHKVDPKYIAAAIDERVEGKVRLGAVVRADGRVDEVQLLHGIDPRLDQSATEALLKWEFAPAERDGQPLPVDVVVEIPFRLAPRLTRR